MKLKQLNESVAKVLLKATVTQAETFIKVLDIEDLQKLQLFLTDNSSFKPKMEGATIDVVKELLSKPITELKQYIVQFINDSLTLKVFDQKYEKQLSSMKISPLSW